MKYVITLLAVVLFAVGSGSAQETESTPAPTPSQSNAIPPEEGGRTQSAAPVATVSPAPEPQGPPQLLPESKTLPPQPPQTPLPRDLIPEGGKPRLPGPVPNPASAEQLEKDKIRFRQIRTIAARNPWAIYFWRRAMTQKTDEMEREYLRVYYITMCDEMRKLEPRLKAIIDGFESVNVGGSSPVGQRPTVPGRDIPRFQASQAVEKVH